MRERVERSDAVFVGTVDQLDVPWVHAARGRRGTGFDCETPLRFPLNSSAGVFANKCNR